jgi:hypothetical protein
MNSNLAEVGKPTRWPPGQSGNPAGKPPGPFENAEAACAKEIGFQMSGYLFEKRSISDCLGYGSESVGSGLAGGAAVALAPGAGGAALGCWPGDGV